MWMLGRIAWQNYKQSNVSVLKANSDPSTWIGSWQRKTGKYQWLWFQSPEDDLIRFQKTVLFHKLKHDYYITVCSIKLLLFHFTFIGESDILLDPWPACGFHWAAQLLWEREVKWAEKECWLTQISRLSLVLLRGWGVSRQLVHEGG